MIAVDTNILLRLVLGDNHKQRAHALALIEKALDQKNDIYINAVVLAEFGWSLKRILGATRAEIATAIARFINCPPFHLFDDEIVQNALLLFENSKADFGDCLISALNADLKIDATYSFDKAAIRSNVFAPL